MVNSLYTKDSYWHICTVINNRDLYTSYNNTLNVVENLNKCFFLTDDNPVYEAIRKIKKTLAAICPIYRY